MAFGRVPVSNKTSDPSGSMYLQSHAPQPHRQGGLWNFLTWSFFLSQVVVAESFIGSRAYAEGEAEGSRGADSSTAQSSGGAGQPPLPGHTNPLEDIATTPLAASAPPQAEHLHARDGSASPHESVLAAHVPVGDHGAAGALPVDSGQSTEGQSAPQPTGFSTEINGSSVALDLVTLPAVGAVGETLDQLVPPVLSTLDNTVGSLDAILDHALASATSLAAPIVDVADAVLQPAAAVVDHVVAPLDAILDHALASGTSLAAPIVDVADGVLQPAAAVVDHAVAPLDAIVDHALASDVSLAVPIVNVADSILQPAVVIVDHAVGPLDAILDPALASGTSFAAPIANAADAMLQPAAAIVDHAVAPISDVLSVQGVVASHGTIVLSEVPLAGALALDDLFSRGTYTAYNLNLNSEPAGASVSLQTGSALVSINIVDDPHGADASLGGPDNTMALHTLPTNALDELHLRGLGEAVSLI